MNDQTKPKRHGCFFYGCIVSLVIFFLVLIGVGTAAFVGYRAVKNLALQYTDTVAMPLPKPQLSPAEIQAVQERFAAFRDGVKSGAAVAPLVLASDEVNALFAGASMPQALRDRVYVKIEGDQVKGQLSLPLDTLGFGFLKGRYLNGAAVFKASLENGVLNVRAESIEVKGKAVPEKIMAALRKQNLAQDVMKDAEAVAVFQKVQSIEIKDDAVTIKAKGPQ